jgi:hypothetical protein
MNRINRLLAVALFVAVTINACAQPQSGTPVDLENHKKEVVSDQDLASWDFRGMGKAFASGGGAFCMTENDSTVGAVMISPAAYTGDVVVRYKTLALTSATVLVFMHSATDVGSDKLTIPGDYNGNMGLWVNEKDNYFYAFRNAPHNFPPFLRKYPVPGGDALVMANENFMLPGVYYAIEIGRIGNRLWLNVDGQKIIETEDESILAGGHLAFRIRGTAGFKAACLIKDVEIYSEK